MGIVINFPKHTDSDSVAWNDSILRQKMETLAAQLQLHGTAKLILSPCVLRHIARNTQKFSEIASLEAIGDVRVERLLSEHRRMEVCARRAKSVHMRLPASDAPRILEIARFLIGRGDLRLDADRLVFAISAFNKIQPLNMAEIWAVPSAMEIALSEAFCEVSDDMLALWNARLQAERWIASDGRLALPKSPSDAFFERAIQLSIERGMPALHMQLEKYLRDTDSTPEYAVRHAHQTRALCETRIDNLLNLCRVLETLRWQDVFPKLSRAEALLLQDNIYAQMDEPSRVLVRTELAEIARRTHYGEIKIAKLCRDLSEPFSEKNPRSTVCYYLYDDEGRSCLACRLGVSPKRIPKMIPDPSGYKLVSVLCVLSALLLALYIALVETPLFWIYGIPFAWCAANMLVGYFFPKFRKPHPLLRLQLDALPEEHAALLVMPVLLSNPNRAEELCRQLETLGCMDDDANTAYLLLGDFPDGNAPHTSQDDEILSRVRMRIAEMNRRAGREKYFYLHRNREYYAPDGRWMGHERKRGALMALNRLLLNLPEGMEAFSAEGSACSRLAGRYSIVCAVDADTRMLPDTLRKLAGTLLHPLNRYRYALLQPNVLPSAKGMKNGFVRVMAGMGGMDSYPVSISNVYQDATGYGCFGGKGMYFVADFMSAVDGKLPDGRILSHDLIEGILCRVGNVCNLALYDEFPGNLSAWSKRLHRWTRGDWQLLPFVFRKSLSPADRIKLLDNLLRSLSAPALIALLTGSAWMNMPAAFSVGIVYAFLAPLLRLLASSADDWKRAVAQFAALPVTAGTQIDAILRTLWRLAFTKKHLLDWVTASDSEHSSDKVDILCRVCAILFLPALLRPHWIPAALSLGILYWLAPTWFHDMEQPDRAELSAEQIALLQRLARDTWHFFENIVTERGHFLPPDNAQIDPPVSVAMRTSPTNIGLYLLSCLAARELGFLSEEDMRLRMGDTMRTLRHMETWRGHLYNWYDIVSLEPLRPRYVSSVDSGNLAACLLLCAQAVGGELADDMRSMAHSMDFSALYNADIDLFAIGMDAEHNRMSASHYDLLASESRILSYVAIMLGQIPLRHWSKLSRACIRLGKGQALASWSGTMFEYLMPNLFFPALPYTLLGESCHAVVRAQRDFNTNRPWGISESGYYAFDLHLNYQYRAFGLSRCALGDGIGQDVVAPYASLLALSIAPSDAADNAKVMREMGWADDMGFYESADYGTGFARLVKSHMAHHQGMALCALCNALTDNALSRFFMSIPQASAISLLLEEKPWVKIRLDPAAKQRHVERVLPPERTERRGNPTRIEVHILSGGGTTAICAAHGGIRLTRHDIAVNRFSDDFLLEDGIFTHAYNLDTRRGFTFGGHAARFDAGTVTYSAALDDISSELTVSVSPEDGTLYLRIVTENPTDHPARMRYTSAFAAALCRVADMKAHPAFQGLFLEGERVRENALLTRRRQRGSGDCRDVLLHAAAGGLVHVETDLSRLRGRGNMIPFALSDTVGHSVHPCSAVSMDVLIEGHTKQQAYFAIGMTSPDKIDAWLTRNADPMRSEQLAATRAKAFLDFLMLSPEKHHLLQRSAALLLDARLAAHAPDVKLCPSVETLWSMGISGDLPILCVFVQKSEHIAMVREGIRAHAFYREMGLPVDFVLLCEQPNDYMQPLLNAVRDMLSASHLGAMFHQSGGAHVLEAQNVSDAQKNALLRYAAMLYVGDSGFWQQTRLRLNCLQIPSAAQYLPMETGDYELPEIPRHEYNGYGGFSENNREYIIDVGERDTPAPWSNILTNEHMGCLLTERGGSFFWHENSHHARITPFYNDALREGWGCMLYLTDRQSSRYRALLPGFAPCGMYRVSYSPAMTRYASGADGLRYDTTFYMDENRHGIRWLVSVRNTESRPRRLSVAAFIDWYMGKAVRAWTEKNICLATGSMRGICFLTCNTYGKIGANRTAFLGHGGMAHPDGLMGGFGSSDGWGMDIPIDLPPNGQRDICFLLGWAEDIPSAHRYAREFSAQNPQTVLQTVISAWRNRLDMLQFDTPDASLNRMMNTFLPQQVMTRIRGRVGLYQSGGAYGFRDQLQDALAILPYDSERARRHILLCAGRQFLAGDVLHWWHMPYTGVRTHIRDDCAFLPYVTAQYVLQTGDAGILRERVPYLADMPIPEGKHDVYAEMRVSSTEETLHEHCMRALRYACQTGAHGLALMGDGDWNDGMNQIGSQGRGESVWLSQFLSVCATLYAEISPSREDAAELTLVSAQMNAAMEEFGWDGEWYRRAYDDDGNPVGSAQNSVCKIDLIAQAWAVLAGLDSMRCAQAMTSAWRMLADERHQIIKLLAPPFDGSCRNPGYIMGYPPGIRENGAQYTHAACWFALALAKQGDAAHAHAAIQMLLPNRHAQNQRAAEIYRAEPYVMAGDVYALDGHVGEGGWTWYTGSAGWMIQAVLALMGYERRGNRVRIAPLLGEWKEAAILLRHGNSRYRLTSSADVREVSLDGQVVQDGWITLADDGNEHIACFPQHSRTEGEA